jgi:hypothetical protein
MGEHRDGKRDGWGVLYMPDRREYEGTWRDNRMHGKGQEHLPNGLSYMVFTDNGKRLEYVTLSKEEGNNKDFLNYAQAQRNAGPGESRASNLSQIYQT